MSACKLAESLQWVTAMSLNGELSRSLSCDTVIRSYGVGVLYLEKIKIQSRHLDLVTPLGVEPTTNGLGNRLQVMSYSD